MADKKKSVYASIADDIIGKIQVGTYSIGSLLPPEREFMTIYSVQRTTVRRGLDILSAEGYIKKVAGLGSVVQSKTPVKDTNYLPADIATQSHIRTAKSHAVLLPSGSGKSIDNMPSLVIDLISSLSKEGGGLITSNVSDTDECDGIIAIDCNPDTKCSVCLALCQSDERRSIILDNDKGAYVALTYLESLGHTKIAFIGTQNGLSFENAAYDSFAAVNSFFDDELINLSGTDEKSGFDGFSELFRRHGGKFTAVCAANNEIAKGILKAAKYYRLNVPGDLSIISLCSSRKDSGIDCIYYDTNSLADEIFSSLEASHRVSTVLFGGNLSISGSCTSTSTAHDSEKAMSDFLL